MARFRSSTFKVASQSIKHQDFMVTMIRTIHTACSKNYSYARAMLLSITFGNLFFYISAPFLDTKHHVKRKKDDATAKKNVIEIKYSV